MDGEPSACYLRVEPQQHQHEEEEDGPDDGRRQHGHGKRVHDEHQRRACNANSVRERERNVLFNDALNTFYLRFNGVRHMVKDHSDSEKGNPLPPHRLLLSINSKGSFICTIPQTG